MPGKAYFLFIGELRFYDLNEYLSKPLSVHYGMPVEPIAIVPDLRPSYTPANIIAMNPIGCNLMKRTGRFVNSRVSGGEFARLVSKNETVVKLVKRLVAGQKTVFINMYESSPEMTLTRLDGVRLLGPDQEIADQYNNKLFQYQAFKGLVPLPPHHLCESFDSLERFTGGLWNEWPDGIFVSEAYSAAGINSMRAKNRTQIVSRFGGKDQAYLVSRYIPHLYDPTVLAVVVNEQEIFISNIADQNIEGVSKFRGSSFPTILPAKICDRLIEHTKSVGRIMGKGGYRGIFGCDYIVTEKDEIFMVEVNARKQGTTIESCLTMEYSLPPSSAILPEIEYHAVTEGRLASSAREMSPPYNLIHWGTYNFKVESDMEFTGDLKNRGTERALFSGLKNRRKDEGNFVILDYPPKGSIVKAGAFAARVVAVDKSAGRVKAGLAEGKTIIRKNLRRWYEP